MKAKRQAAPSDSSSVKVLLLCETIQGMRIALIIAYVAWTGVCSAIAPKPVIEVGDEGFNPAEGAVHDSFRNRATLINQWRIDAKSKFFICLNKTAEFDGLISERRDAVKKMMSQLKKGDPQKKVLTTYSAELTAYVEGPMRQFREVCNKLETYLNELDVFEVQTRDYYGAGPSTTVDTGLGEGYLTANSPGQDSPSQTALVASSSSSVNLLSTSSKQIPMPESEFKKKELDFAKRMEELKATFNQNPILDKAQATVAVPVPINLVATNANPKVATPPSPQDVPSPSKSEEKLLSVFKKAYGGIQ